MDMISENDNKTICNSELCTSKEASLREPPSDLCADKKDASSIQPKTRLLRDVEAKENQFIYNALYKPLDDAVDEQINQELTTSEMLRQMDLSREDFRRAISMPISEKSKGCALLFTQLQSAHSQRVINVFIGFSIVMFTFPILVLLFGMYYIAPLLGINPVVCGGFASLVSVVALMICYTIYAFMEDTSTSSSHSEVGDKKKN
ncbi:unnamed protein product [Phytomonas sp. Hart1]|nr:unnamed protein product [Phytomonas sp. Hart1]|eukprot:CCW68929.1 unnamed protein product [Phytomonas sp. isolate Hart1]